MKIIDRWWFSIGFVLGSIGLSFIFDYEQGGWRLWSWFACYVLCWTMNGTTLIRIGRSHRKWKADFEAMKANMDFWKENCERALEDYRAAENRYAPPWELTEKKEAFENAVKRYSKEIELTFGKP